MISFDTATSVFFFGGYIFLFAMSIYNTKKAKTYYDFLRNRNYAIMYGVILLLIILVVLSYYLRKNRKQ
jgi:hypothetical protein